MTLFNKIIFGILIIVVVIWSVLKEIKRFKGKDLDFDYNDLKIWGALLGLLIIGFGLIYQGLNE